MVVQQADLPLQNKPSRIMGRLDQHSRTLLTAADFAQHLVWARNEDDSAYLPLDETAPSLEKWGTLFVAAEITAGAQQLEGYLVIDQAGIHSIHVFVGDEVFNFKEPGVAYVSEIDRVAAKLGCTKFEILPLRYESGVQLKIGGLILPPVRPG
jgi:hypothetical protein